MDCTRSCKLGVLFQQDFDVESKTFAGSIIGIKNVKLNVKLQISPVFIQLIAFPIFGSSNAMEYFREICIAYCKELLLENAYCQHCWEFHEILWISLMDLWIFV